MAGRGTAVLGGASVLVVTAYAAVVEFMLPGTSFAYKIAGGALVALLLVGAWLLARFVRAHGDEIGEARFDTRNKDEREG
jgi:membrane protein implicated in regulation of membrane protease activity